MSLGSPGRDEYESDGSIDNQRQYGYDSSGSVAQSQKSYGSDQDDMNHEGEHDFEGYALQRRQPPGELVNPLLSENEGLRVANKNLLYKVCALKVIQNNLITEIVALKDAVKSLSLENNELKCMNEESRLSSVEEDARTMFKLRTLGVDLHMERETKNKQRMKQKFRE